MLWIHYWYKCADFKRFCSSRPISVWASLCRMIHVQSLTLEDRFYILNLICAIFLFFFYFFLTWETFLAVVPRSQINNRGNEAHFWRPVAALFYNKSRVEHHVIRWVNYSNIDRRGVTVCFLTVQPFRLCCSVSKVIILTFLLNHNHKYSVSVVLRWIITLLIPL